MTTTIDLRGSNAHKTLEQVQRETPIEFTPDETPDEARMWLAQQRFERDTSAPIKPVIAMSNPTRGSWLERAWLGVKK